MNMHIATGLLTVYLSALHVQVEYEDLGGLREVQVWDVRCPFFIKEDWRDGERFKASLTVSPQKRNTLEGMLFNVALITPFAMQCATWFNERLKPN